MLTTMPIPNTAGVSGQAPENSPLYATETPENSSAHTPGTTETAETDETSERLVLFSLNGVDYTVPKKIGPNVAIGYLRDIRRHGKEHAIAGIMEALLGKDALDALADYEDLTEEDLEQVMNAVQAHVLGPLEKRAGKR